MAFQWASYCSNPVAKWGNFEVLNKIGRKMDKFKFNKLFVSSHHRKPKCYILSRSCPLCPLDSVSSAIQNLCVYMTLCLFRDRMRWWWVVFFWCFCQLLVLVAILNRVVCQNSLTYFVVLLWAIFDFFCNGTRRIRFKIYFSWGFWPKKQELSRTWFLCLFWEAVWDLIITEIIAALISQPVTWASLSHTGNNFGLFTELETNQRSTNFINCCSRSYRPLVFFSYVKT